MRHWQIASAALGVMALTAALAVSPASAQDGYRKQAITMKKKLAASKGAGVTQPTGIEVPGCTWYTLSPSGGVSAYCNQANVRDQAGFYRDYVGRYSNGSSE